MDSSVIAAMAKWPNVPDCHGWLSLDRRGQWRLQGSPVRHAGLADFIGRNYECDDTGAWFMQNGPQRVWVELAATPWVLRLDHSAGLVTHTGMPTRSARGAWLVENEQLCLMTEHGLGLIDDRDLPALIEHLRTADGRAPECFDGSSELFLHGFGPPILLRRCHDEELPAIGHFRRHPREPMATALNGLNSAPVE